MNVPVKMPNFEHLVRAALREDRAFHDATARAFVPAALKARGRVVARAEGVLAGGAAAALAFRLVDARSHVRLLKKDGARLRPGQSVLEVRGRLAALLAAERTALNILTHASGIASLTRRFVAAAGPGPAVLDTRKTLPGLRALEKWAVLCGGGRNHRRDLSDQVLVKENHLAALRTEEDLAGFWRKIRVLRARGRVVEMECQNKKQVLWALLGGVDIALLDNFPPRILPKVVKFIDGFCRRHRLKRPLTEVSGGVTLENIRAYARSGVDRISVGRLTHSAPALDMSLDVRAL